MSELPWPQRIVESLSRAPVVGDWFAECCIQDFHQIADAEELADLLEHYSDFDTGGMFWATEFPARDELEEEEGHASNLSNDIHPPKRP